MEMQRQPVPHTHIPHATCRTIQLNLCQCHVHVCVFMYVCIFILCVCVSVSVLYVSVYFFCMYVLCICVCVCVCVGSCFKLINQSLGNFCKHCGCFASGQSALPSAFRSVYERVGLHLCVSVCVCVLVMVCLWPFHRSTIPHLTHLLVTASLCGRWNRCVNMLHTQ